MVSLSSSQMHPSERHHSDLFSEYSSWSFSYKKSGAVVQQLVFLHEQGVPQMVVGYQSLTFQLSLFYMKGCHHSSVLVKFIILQNHLQFGFKPHISQNFIKFAELYISFLRPFRCLVSPFFNLTTGLFVAALLWCFAPSFSYASCPDNLSYRGQKFRSIFLVKIQLSGFNLLQRMILTAGLQLDFLKELLSDSHVCVLRYSGTVQYGSPHVLSLVEQLRSYCLKHQLRFKMIY